MRFVILLLMIVALAGCAKRWTGNAHDFAYTNLLDGQTMKLSSLAGKPVVLNFWADW